MKLRTGRCTEFETDVHVCLRPHRGLNETNCCKKDFSKAKNLYISMYPVSDRKDIGNWQLCISCSAIICEDAFKLTVQRQR